MWCTQVRRQAGDAGDCWKHHVSQADAEADAQTLRLHGFFFDMTVGADVPIFDAYVVDTCG